MTPDDNDARPSWTDPSTPVVPATPVAAPPRQKSGTWVNLLLGAAAIVAVGGVAFAVGRVTAPTATVAVGADIGGASGGFLRPGGSFDPDAALDGNFGGRGGALFGTGGPTISGTVGSVNGGSLTVTLDSGDTVTVTLDADTTYHQSSGADQSDVAVGDDVSVRLSGGRFQPGDDGTSAQVSASDVTVSR